MEKIKLEICTATPKSILAASDANATRVEVCSSLIEGGITPPTSWIKLAKECKNLQVHALIRPRGGNFLYNSFELQTMINDIKFFGEIGCDGVVFGTLNSENKINIKENTELLRIAKSYGMKCTFHRAIDQLENPVDAVETIINMGFDKILSSGGKLTAMDGIPVLQKMIEKADNRIVIMPAAGISENNIGHLVQSLDTYEFHGSFSKSQTFPCFNPLFKENMTIKQTSRSSVEQAIFNANKVLAVKLADKKN